MRRRRRLGRSAASVPVGAGVEKDDLLTGMPNVLLTQHVAASSIESLRDIHAEAANQALALLEQAGRLARQ